MRFSSKIKLYTHNYNNKVAVGCDNTLLLTDTKQKKKMRQHGYEINHIQYFIVHISKLVITIDNIFLVAHCISLRNPMKLNFTNYEALYSHLYDEVCIEAKYHVCFKMFMLFLKFLAYRLCTGCIVLWCRDARCYTFFDPNINRTLLQFWQQKIKIDLYA